jgi:beta-lactamase class A
MMLALLFAVALDKFDGVAGYSAMNLDTGQRLVLRGDERFPMGSVFKFPTAIALLQRVDRGQFRLDQNVTITPDEFSVGWSPIRDNAHGKPVTLTVRELLESMLGQSDNTAADKVLAMLGGPDTITALLGDFGLLNMSVNRNEAILGRDAKADVEAYWRDPRDTSTPDAMIALLRLFYERRDTLSPSSHDLMMKIMEASTIGPHRIREAVPKGSVVAHKTGSMPGVANDVGIVTSPDGKHHIAIAIFTKASKMSEADRDALIREITRSAYDALLSERRPK